MALTQRAPHTVKLAETEYNQMEPEPQKKNRNRVGHLRNVEEVVHQGAHVFVYKPPHDLPRLVGQRRAVAALLSRKGQHRQNALPPRPDVARSRL